MASVVVCAPTQIVRLFASLFYAIKIDVIQSEDILATFVRGGQVGVVQQVSW